MKFTNLKLSLYLIIAFLDISEVYKCFCSYSGETDSAKAMLTHCLDQDSTFSDAHLLMAQVNVTPFGCH